MVGTSERRKVARLILPWHLHGRVLGVQEVRILDLGPVGVRIEHVERLRPGISFTLEFPPPLGPLRLAARVVWSQVRGSELTPEGERRLQYQSGLTFVKVTGDQQAGLAHALEKINAARAAKDRNPTF